MISAPPSLAPIPWPLFEFRDLVKRVGLLETCSSCSKVRLEFVQEVFSLKIDPLNDKFFFETKRLYQLPQSLCQQDRRLIQKLFSQYAAAYPLSPLTPFSAQQEGPQPQEQQRHLSSARTLAFLYFTSFDPAVSDRLQEKLPSLKVDIPRLSSVEAQAFVRQLEVIDLIRHVSLLETIPEASYSAPASATTLPAAFGAMSIAGIASCASGVGIPAAVAIGAASGVAAAAGSNVARSLCTRSPPDSLTYTALSSLVAYAYDRSSAPTSRFLLHRDSTTVGYVRFLLSEEAAFPLYTYAPFDFRNTPPISPASLWELRQSFEQALVAPDRLEHFIAILQTASLCPMPTTTTPKLIDAHCVCIMSSLLQGKQRRDAIVGVLTEAQHTTTLVTLRTLIDALRTRFLETRLLGMCLLAPQVSLELQTVERIVPGVPHFPARELRDLATRIKMIIPCDECKRTKLELFQGIASKQESEIEKDFKSLAERVYTCLFYPSDLMGDNTSCDDDKKKFPGFYEPLLQNHNSWLFPLLSFLPTLGEQLPLATDETAKRESTAQVLAYLYAVSSKLFLPVQRDATDLIRQHQPDLLRKVNRLDARLLLRQLEMALFRHHFVLKYFRARSEQEEKSRATVISAGASVAATACATAVVGPLAGAIALVPSYSVTDRVVSMLTHEYEKSPSTSLVFTHLTEDVLYAFNNTSSGAIGNMRGAPSYSVGYIRIQGSFFRIDCPFELYKPEPLGPSTLWELREALKVCLKKGLITPKTLRSIIHTLRSTTLQNSSIQPHPKLLSLKTSVYLTSILVEYLASHDWGQDGNLDEKNEARNLIVEAIQEDLITCWPAVVENLTLR